MGEGQGNRFGRLVWKPDDCMLIDELVFRIQHHKSGTSSGGEHFAFYKIKELIDQYEHFFRWRSDFHPGKLFELGIFDGGSIAFWHEILKPRKHVAIDLMDVGDHSYLRRYLESRGLTDRIKTYWNTDQADKTRLRGIVESEFGGPPDLVIDDASHVYGPTLASFEALFPLMAAGGLYIIEDWAWAHWKEGMSDPYWSDKVPLTKLAVELIEATGTWTDLIADISVYRGFLAIERGSQAIADPASFRLDEYIYRGPNLRPQTAGP